MTRTHGYILVTGIGLVSAGLISAAILILIRVQWLGAIPEYVPLFILLAMGIGGLGAC
jgi:hypothetical protein